jgi:hypothetical protein
MNLVNSVAAPIGTITTSIEPLWLTVRFIELTGVSRRISAATSEECRRSFSI